MKKSLFAAMATAAAVLLMGACNKHSWDSTQKIYPGPGHGHGHGDDHEEGDHDKAHADGDENHHEGEEK